MNEDKIRINVFIVTIVGILGFGYYVRFQRESHYAPLIAVMAGEVRGNK